MTSVKYGTGALDPFVAGSRNAVRDRAGLAIAEFAALGGINERGRAISARTARGLREVSRPRVGAGISERIGSGRRQGRGPEAVSERTASGYARIDKAFDIPDSTGWFTHAVNVRQITRGSTAGVQGNFLGSQFTATFDGMNAGENGHAGGSWERRMYEEGDFTVRFPNREGSDGRLHRERFRPMSDPFFHPGDEWVEIYDRGGDLVYVGATRDAEIDLQKVEVRGSDGSILLRKTREYWAGFWNHAPHDVWEHYLSVWRMVVADDFGGDDPTGGGKFVTLNAHATPLGDSAVLLYTDAPTGGAANERARIRANNSYAFPIGVEEGDTTWRVECQFWRNQFGPPANPEEGDNAYVRVGMWDVGANDALCVLQMQEQYTYLSNDGGHTLWRTGSPTDGKDTFHVVLEGRDRWIYGFINQRFVGSIPLPPGSTSCVPFVAMRPGATTAHQRVRVESFSCRRTVPYLRPAGSQWGDYRLPGNPVPGGLKGTYYNDLGLKENEYAGEDGETPNPNHYAMTVFSPWHKLHGPIVRHDDQINFVSPQYQTNPPRWPAAGATTTDSDPSTGIPGSQVGKWFSVRWTGSIYLPLGDTDCSISITTAEGFRLWVGKTKFRDAAIDTWLSPGSGSTGSLRSHIGTESDGAYHNGWYPLLIEYGQRGDGGASISMSMNGSVVQPEHLSPMGIFDEHVRLDSHWEVIQTLSETYGYQFTCEPRQFESGEFPGVMVPRVRVGRDTEKIVDDVNSANYRVRVTGDSVADSILSDGAGLGSSEVQQVLEAMDYENIMSTLFIHTEYESWGDMTWEPVLAQRANTLLALRASPWEEVDTQPFGAPEMLDSFPLTGNLALFRWEPGDGVRLVLPVINVEDASPRQILGVTYPFVPEGRQGPSVSFRNRPRGMREFLRRVQRQYMNRSRNYQKQLVAHTGSLAAFGGSALIDEFSRVALPHDLSDVIRAEVTVFEKPDDTPWYIWINEKPTTHPPVRYPGKYDISGYVERWNNLPIMRVEFRTVAE